MIRLAATLTPLLLTAACATDPGPAQSAAAPEAGTAQAAAGKPSVNEVCEWAAPTGSRFKQKVCWTDAEAAQAKDQARRFKDSFERTPAVQPKGR
ncbi:MAG: hypothetical protein J0L58_01725 [Burkholderiales bacterium]|uniref:hypothetical protein n=1 Tax=Inhella sp. TaxID=1921806 RepID=UPI001AC36587|nr:hypothetical protein [Burkholderiales bacterium]